MDRLAQLLEFHEEDPDDSFVRFAIASEYVKHGLDQDGRGFFERIVHDDPDYVGTYYHLGKLYERIGELELAMETYKSGIEIASGLSDYHAQSELQSALLEADGYGFD